MYTCNVIAHNENMNSKEKDNWSANILIGVVQNNAEKDLLIHQNEMIFFMSVCLIYILITKRFPYGNQ